MKRRHCIKCSGYVRPTRRMGLFSSDLRFFRCIDCGHESQWVDKPELDGTFGELHKQDGGYVVCSMVSDPMMSFKEKKKKSNRRSKIRK